MIKIPLSTVTGNEFAVYINPESTVGQLKQLLEKEYNLHSFYLKLIYQAVILPDNKKIKDINIVNDSCIFVHQSNLRAARPTKPGPLPTNHESKVSHHFIPTPEKSPGKLHQNNQIENLNDNNTGSDSQHFSSLVENLKDLGFEQKLCEDALRMSNNDVNAAATLLISENPSIYQSPNQQQQNNKKQQSLTIEDELDHMASQYKKLTYEQQAAVERLQKLGFHIETVMQVYFACGKSEQAARECLLTMK